VSQRPAANSGQKPSQKARHRPSSVKSLMPLSEAMILSIANQQSLQQVSSPHMRGWTAIVFPYILKLTLIFVVELCKSRNKSCNF